MEANVFLEEANLIQQLDGYFDELFEGGRARTVSDTWLKGYAVHWEKMKKLDRAQRKLRGQLSRRRTKVSTSELPIPTRVRNVCYAFTGKIDGRPREKDLYPLVRKLGGTIAPHAGSMGSASALVHGDILGGLKTTRKLKAAKRQNIPIISEDDFFEAVRREKRARARKP